MFSTMTVEHFVITFQSLIQIIFQLMVLTYFFLCYYISRPAMLIFDEIILNM